jgi:outer membrane protein OmpA-like peptidoglycan-associated protein
VETKTLNNSINPLERKMKKSLLNIAVSIAMSGTLLSASLLSSQAYADTATIDDATIDDATAAVSADSNDVITGKTYLYPGMGVGAASGTLVAGPIGFLIGGIIGGFIGAGQDASESTPLSAEVDTIAEIPLQHDSVEGMAVTPEIDAIGNSADTPVTVATQPAADHGIQLAQIGDINAVIADPQKIQQEIQQDELVNSLTTDLALDVYFRSGSSAVETFYPARLAAIASLLNSMDRLGSDRLQLHLDGYSDRRGEQAKNIALANERIENVRQQLIAAGVAEDRISGQAFGEMKMVSTAGDLEGYTFDRKVVIRFERIKPETMRDMTTASAAPTETVPGEAAIVSDHDAGINPIIADAGSSF